MQTPFLQSKINTILFTGFVAVTLDISSAIVFLAKGNAEGVLRFIAKGAVGTDALEGGSEMLLLGMVIHFIIAFCFAIGYFVVFPYVPFLRKYKVISGLLYGIFVWAFMRYVVLPMTFNPPGPLTFENAWKNIVILMLAIGLPISLIVHRHDSLRQ